MSTAHDRTPEKKELDRNAILIALADFNPRSTTVNGITQRLNIEGVKIEPANLDQDLAYLSGKDLIIQQHAELSVGVKHYRITATGQEYLEAKGFA